MARDVKGVALCVSEGRRPRRPQASSPANGTKTRKQSRFSPDRGIPLPPNNFNHKEHKEHKETIACRFAAEASKNLGNAESNSDLLDRGCVSRRRIFYYKEHKETIAYRFA